MSTELCLYVLQVSALTNNLMIADGWQVGQFLHEVQGCYVGPTFDASSLQAATFYTTRSEAERALSKRANRKFVGVEFKVVKFREVAAESNWSHQAVKREIARADAAERELAAMREHAERESILRIRAEKMHTDAECREQRAVEDCAARFTELESLRKWRAELESEVSAGRPSAEDVARSMVSKVIADGDPLTPCSHVIEDAITRERLIGALQRRRLREALEESALQLNEDLYFIDNGYTPLEEEKWVARISEGIGRITAALASAPDEDVIEGLGKTCPHGECRMYELGDHK